MKDRELIELEGFPPLSLSVRHFSLMNSLLTVFNSTEPGDPENTIAQFFLEHFENLDQLNVYDVAEECYTSRSAVLPIYRIRQFFRLKSMRLGVEDTSEILHRLHQPFQFQSASF